MPTARSDERCDLPRCASQFWWRHVSSMISAMEFPALPQNLRCRFLILQTGKEVLLPAPSNYPEELRERAVRLYRECGPRPTIRRLAEQLKVPPETLRSWIRQDQAERGERNHRPSAATHTPQARGGQMVAVMRMTGELDRAALDALEHTATEHFTAGASTVVIDFAAVTAFPSALFTRLHQLDTRARAHRRRLRLVHLDQAVRTMISQLRASPDLPTPAIPQGALPAGVSPTLDAAEADGGATDRT
jgi:transposase